MGIERRPRFQVPVADTSTPFDITLAVTATAEDAAVVPVGKRGRNISIVNEGPGSVAIAFDATALVTDLLLEDGDAYDDINLDINTNVSFINVTPTNTPRVRGILWSGNPV